MTPQAIQPEPGRRPVYPVDSDAQQQHPGKKPDLPPPGSKDDPASDENTEPANHPNDG